MKAAVIALCMGIAALGQVPAAQAQTSDPHIKMIAYDPGTVVHLVGSIGWQIMIEMADDERIENVSIGDSAAWQITPNKRARMLFVRPLSRKASTNMTVITTKRSYVFDLSVGPRRPGTPWIVRFSHPQPEVEVALLDLPPPPPPVELDFNYTRTGDASLLPSRVWDDGRQTYFEFAKETAMPAIFAGAPGKDEALVNISVRGRVAVVQQRSPRFTLRSGKRLATVAKQAQGASDAP
jgi:type IV secretion system protein VirB9